MTTVVNIVPAREMGRPFLADPELKLPDRPRLIPELLVCPIGPDGLLFSGAQSTQVLRGRSARQLLPRVIPLLDGTRRCEELLMSLPGLKAETLFDVLSLLFSRGLIEDGGASFVDQSEFSETARFLGRHNDVSRRNRNRAEAMARLAQSSVRIVGPDSLVYLVREQLVQSGVIHTSCNREGAGRSDLTVAISTGDAPIELGVLKVTIASCDRTVIVRLGEHEAQNRSASDFRCYCMPRLP